MQRIIYTFFLAFLGLFLSNQMTAQDCDAGSLTTVGEITLCTVVDTFDLEATDTVIIPTDGGYGWIFSNDLGGAGALGGTFILSGSEPQSTFDGDLNGILSSNGLPAFAGVWVVKGAAYSDPDNAFSTICSMTADSLIVNFSNFSATGVNNGDGTATVNPGGGTMPYTYMWTDGQTDQTAINLPMGMIGVTVTDVNGCTAETAVNVSDVIEPCTEWEAPNPDGGWTDFNDMFGGAPCDDGTGCPFNEITDFEVFAAEAYSVDGFVIGGTYSFSMCNGDGAGAWVPEFTVIAPSGAVDAFGAGDGDGCTITWTASEEGTYLIAINEAGFCGGGDNTGTDNGFPALTCTSGAEVMCAPVNETCDAGTLTTLGEITLCTVTDTFDLEAIDTVMIPDNGGYGWVFSNDLGGTGALGGTFILQGSDPQATFDGDLNGILSSNGLPAFAGVWVVKGAAYADDMDAFATICSTTVDSLIVNFSNFSATAVNNGDGTATINTMGGTMPYTYMWADGQTDQTAIDLPMGMIGVTVTDANDCTSETSVNISDVIDPCIEWQAPNPDGGWTDFNSMFGGAPCDDGTGCPFNEVTAFEVFAAEAYSVDGFMMGGTYSFSMCNGDGAGTWIPEFTIIAPSGAVDAFGAGDGDGCTITWTASEEGTYLIVINEAGFCGGGDNTGTDNGFPALTCTSGPEVACPPVDETCESGILSTVGEVSVCDDSTFDLSVEGDSINIEGGFGWVFDPVLGGTGALDGAFILTAAPQVETYDNDLNGVLSSNGLPIFAGTWIIKGAVYSDGNDAFNTICMFTADSLVVTFSESPTLSIDDNGDGSATANAMGGIPPYTYAWEDGQTGQTATGLTGTVTVVVTDNNGCTVDGSVDVVVSVENIEQLDLLEISPNPTTGQFVVKMELNTAETVSIEVLDLMGRTIETVIKEQTTNTSITFDLSDSAAGIYMLRVQVGDKSLVRRIMIGQ